MDVDAVAADDRQGPGPAVNGAVAKGRRAALPALPSAVTSSSSSRLSSGRERKKGSADASSLADSVDGAVRERLAGRDGTRDRGTYGSVGGAGLDGREGEVEGRGEVDPIFAMLDANGDGVISVEEMREFVRELGAPLPVTPNLREASGLGLLGVGADRAAPPALGPSASRGSSKEGEHDEEWEAARQLVALMDANTDGTVCAEEFAEFRRQVSELCSVHLPAWGALDHPME